MRPKHWSWSALETYETCPRRWWYKYIGRLPDPPGPHLERGRVVHDALELALQAKDATVDFGGPWLANQLDLYRSFGAEAEASYFVDREWSEVAPDPDRFIPGGTYTMAKLDVYSPREGFFADWKTGKLTPRNVEKHAQQAKLYATVLMSITGRRRLDVDLVYVDHQHVEQLAFEFDLDELERQQAKWDARARPLFEATDWPKKPSKLCDFCPFHVSKGGPCDGRKEKT